MPGNRINIIGNKKVETFWRSILEILSKYFAKTKIKANLIGSEG